MIMKTKICNYLFSAVLMMGIATMMTGCAKEDIASNDNGGGTNPTDMNVDELNVKVTADVPTAVLSSFDAKSMGGALVRRLSKTTSSLDADTKMVLIKGEDILNRPITEWFEVAKIYLRGGYIAVEKPHNAHLVSVMEQLSTKFAQAEEDILLKGGVSIVRPAGGNTNAQSSHVNRFKTRIANIQAKSDHRAASDEQQPVAEMVIFSINGYYHCAPSNSMNVIITSRDKSGKETSKTETITRQYSAYEMGLQADGAAQWLNNRDAAQQVRRASNRADGNDAINDLMSANDEITYQSDLAAYLCNYGECEYSDGYHGGDIVTYDGPRDVGCYSKPRSYNETIRYWGVHNMDTNKDYYLIQQKGVASVGGQAEENPCYDHNKTLYMGPYENNKWISLGFGSGGGYCVATDVWCNVLFGAWYNQGDYSLDLKGESGEILLEDAVPTTENNLASTSVTVGEFQAQNTRIGGTLSGVFTTKEVGARPGLSISQGWTTGSIYMMTSTRNAQELGCVKNTEGTKVSWTYKVGVNMMDGDDDEHPLPPAILVNDADVHNEACWSVSNPSGAYTVEIARKTSMGTLVSSDGNSFLDTGPKTLVNTGCAADSMSITLMQPNRAQQMWNMDVTFPEIAQDGYDKVKPQLTEALKNQFPSVYQPEMQLADLTEDSENTIRLILAASRNLLMDENALQTLREYAQTFKISEFTIKWYSPGTNHNTFHFTVKANGDPEGKDISIEPTDLSKLKNDFIAIDGDVLTGTLAGNYKITVAPGATITLKNATINGTNDEACNWAGITCMGDATIVLADGSKNVIKGFYAWQPGIFVPEGKKLTIQGNTGTLDASSNGQACGIGGNNNQNSGSIEIQGGVITATGGDNDAGIGGGFKRGCGDIVISGGTVTATGGYGAAGIGSGRSKDGVTATCGNITISGGTVTATAGAEASAIGAGAGSSCGSITITKGVKSVTATGGIKGSGTVTIEEGANVIQK